MRTAWKVISDTIDASLQDGRIAYPDTILAALRDEGWHLLSTPQVEERYTPEFGFPQREYRVSLVLDDELLSAAKTLTEQSIVESNRAVVTHVQHVLGANLARTLGEKIGLYETTP